MKEIYRELAEKHADTLQQVATKYKKLIECIDDNSESFASSAAYVGAATVESIRVCNESLEVLLRICEMEEKLRNGLGEQ